jgi:hypothetical protein
VIVKKSAKGRGKVMTVMGRLVIHNSPAKFPASTDPQSDEALYQEALRQFKGAKEVAAPAPKSAAESAADKALKDAEEGKAVRPKGYFRR